MTTLFILSLFPGIMVGALVAVIYFGFWAYLKIREILMKKLIIGLLIAAGLIIIYINRVEILFDLGWFFGEFIK